MFALLNMIQWILETHKESPIGECLSLGGLKEELEWEESWPGKKQTGLLFLAYLTLKRLIPISDLLFVNF